MHYNYITAPFEFQDQLLVKSPFKFGFSCKKQSFFKIFLLSERKIIALMFEATGRYKNLKTGDGGVSY